MKIIVSGKQMRMLKALVGLYDTGAKGEITTFANEKARIERLDQDDKVVIELPDKSTRR